MLPDLDPLLERGTTKAACVIEDPAEVDRATALLARELAGSARITRSNPEFVEILDPEVSKATACEIVCGASGCSLADAVAVGDAPNDIELLAAPDTPSPSRRRAPRCSPSRTPSCAVPEDGGVADVLEALGLR